MFMSFLGMIVGIIIFVAFWAMIIKKIRSSFPKSVPPVSMPEKKGRLDGAKAMVRRYWEERKKSKKV